MAYQVGALQNVLRPIGHPLLSQAVSNQRIFTRMK